MSDCFDHAGDAGAFPLGMHSTPQTQNSYGDCPDCGRENVRLRSRMVSGHEETTSDCRCQRKLAGGDGLSQQSLSILAADDYEV